MDVLFMLNNLDFNIKNNNILYISQFGSFGTSEWIQNISDIDIGVILKSFHDIDFSLEDFLTSKFEKIYKTTKSKKWDEQLMVRYKRNEFNNLLLKWGF